MRVRELAERLSLPLEGNGDLNLTGAAELERAAASELAFVGAKKFFKIAASSVAGCLIVTEDFPASDRTLLRAKEPRAAFAAALQLLYPAQPAPIGIHPSAVIEDGVTLGINVSVGPQATISSGAVIGDNSRIGAGCVIGSGVKLGSNVTLHPRVTVYAGVEIGDRSIVHSGAVIGADGFGFVPIAGVWHKFPQVGGVRIGDDVEIGANSCIDRAALGLTVIGNGVKLDNLVHIAHNCQIGDHVVIAAQTGLSGGVTIEHHAIIGGQVGIGDKARIESGAVLGSGCGVLTSKIVRAGEPVWGTPARPLREYLGQLAQVGRLPQMRDELRQLQQAVRDLTEQLGLPPTAPDAPDLPAES
jgi:UDP-3-O-[3-hydroxymyristoyl] glucosamine N-acyltransferase